LLNVICKRTESHSADAMDSHAEIFPFKSNRNWKSGETALTKLHTEKWQHGTFAYLTDYVIYCSQFWFHFNATKPRYLTPQCIVKFSLIVQR